jgi:hypothetical protein
MFSLWSTQSFITPFASFNKRMRRSCCWAFLICSILFLGSELWWSYYAISTLLSAPYPLHSIYILPFMFEAIGALFVGYFAFNILYEVFRKSRDYPLPSLAFSLCGISSLVGSISTLSVLIFSRSGKFGLCRQKQVCFYVPMLENATTYCSPENPNGFVCAYAVEHTHVPPIRCDRMVNYAPKTRVNMETLRFKGFASMQACRNFYEIDKIAQSLRRAVYLGGFAVLTRAVFTGLFYFGYVTLAINSDVPTHEEAKIAP